MWLKAALAAPVLAGALAIGALTLETGNVTESCGAFARLGADVAAVARMAAIYAWRLRDARFNSDPSLSREAAKSACHTEAAAVLRDLMMRNGGVYIKFGQHIGTVSSRLRLLLSGF